MATQKHAGRTMATRQLVVGGVIGVAGVAMATTSVGLGVLLTGVGGLLFALGVSIRRSSAAAELINPALDAITRGDLAAAEERLDRAEPAYRASHIQRVVASQRALIAWRRGDLGEVERRTSSAVSLSRGWLTGASEAMVDIELRAQRALARAASGDVDGARADIEAVRGSADRTATSAARAELAEALVLERGGDRAALRGHLSRHRHLLMDGSAPHEREMVRALTRLARAKVASAYREPVGATTDSTEATPAFEAWIATVVPSAAPYVAPSHDAARPAPPIAATPVASEADRARYQVRAVKAPTRASGRLTLAVWMLLIVMFLAIWQLTSVPSSSGPDSVPDEPTLEEPSEGPFGWLGLGLAAFAIVGAAAWFRRILRKNEVLVRSLHVADIEIVAGAVGEPTRALLERLARDKAKGIAAQAELSLASISDQQARFDEVLAHCDRGIDLVTSDEGAYVSSVDLLLPQLATIRAATLAAIGRFDEAHREAAAIAQQFPTYPMLSHVALLVDLIHASKSGDVQRAAAVAAGASPSMPLRSRHAMLADLARAVGGEVGAEERESLREDLRTDGKTAAWVRAVAPELVARFTEPEPTG